MKIDRILVPLDGSRLAEQALPYAAALARASDASVHVMAVVPELTLFDVAGVTAALAREQERSLAGTRAYVDRRVAELQAASLRATGEAAVGAPASALLEAAKSVDVVVMTSHARGGVARLWLGSVADAVVRRASVPVLVLRPEEPVRAGRAIAPRIARILVPLDGSTTSESALDSAIGLAQRIGASITLLMVVEGMPLPSPDLAFSVYFDPAMLFELHENATRYLDRTAARVRAAGVAAATITSDGVPVAAEIAAYARDNGIDLVVMASHGRGGVRRLLLGSVADKLLRQTEVPVLVVPAAAPGRARPQHHEAWQRELAAFAEHNHDRLVTIEVDSPALGSQREIDRLALRDADYDWREDRLSIALHWEGGGHLVHRVGRPERVDVVHDVHGDVLVVRSRDGSLTLRVVSAGPAVRVAGSGAVSSQKGPDTDSGLLPTPAPGPTPHP